MFTGIVSGVAEVVALTEPAEADGDARVALLAPADAAAWRAPPEAGASVCCAGVCLTARAGTRMKEGRAWFEVDISAATRARTTLGAWSVGSRVNVEAALRMGDALGGHLLAGHVDAVARVEEVEPLADGRGSRRVTARAPAAIAPLLAARGSVGLDGVSLTPTRVDDAGLVEVNLVPHTLQTTTLGAWRVGTAVNLEVDLLARYVARAIEARNP